MLKVILQTCSYLIALVVPYFMLFGKADSFFYFPFIVVSVLVLLYYSGPLAAMGMLIYSVLIGTGGLIFSMRDLSSGAPVIFFAQLTWLCFLSWKTEKLVELQELEIHRLQEEMEKLDLLSSDYERQKEDVEDFCQGIQQRFDRYSQLQSFTDQIATSLQVKDIEERTESTLNKLFSAQGSISAQVLLFPHPNSAQKDDPVGDWIVKHRIPLLVDDCTEDSRFSTPHWPRRKGSMIACPIEREDAVIGTMRIESPTAKIWKEEDLRLLSDISNIVSLSMINALYYEKVESLAVKDSLTGLFVRYRFDERMEEEFFRSKASRSPLSLILFDIDHFKGVNDQWGHPMGDLVLKSICQTIVSQTRETDFCARYGGEEIVVLMPFTTLENSFQIAQRIHQNVASTPIGPKKINVTISGGVGSIHPGYQTAREMIDAVDRALYAAKRDGRNKVLKVEL